jgi:hypothetical protein
MSTSNAPLQTRHFRKVVVTYPGGLKKIGLGRVVDGAKTIERLTAADKSRGGA